MSASYPTAVKTFTTKNNSDPIQAAHVNDLQDEVTALESGLLTGTAPLSCSNATVSSLAITGGFTAAAGAIGYTFDSTASVWTALNSSGVEVASGGAVSVANNSFVGILTVLSQTDAVVGQFALRAGSLVVDEVLDPTGVFSTVRGTTGSYNCYYDSTLSRYRVENRRGSTNRLKFMAVGG